MWLLEKNLGTKAGIKLVKKYIEEHKKYETFYILKLDISKYFYTIDHKVLKHMIKPKLTEFEYHYISSIIDSTNESYINQKIEYLKQGALNDQNEKEISKIPFYEKGKGLPIGNMTSQFLSIFYLHALDHKIIHDYHIKHYVRYMDDFLLIHYDKQYLKEILKKITFILEHTYQLKINQNKTKIYNSKEGFEFLGYRFKIVNHQTIMTVRKESLRRIKKRIKEINYLYKHNKIPFETAFSSINNYLHSYKGSKSKIKRRVDRYWFEG